MTKPRWKAINAKLRKERTEKAKHEKELFLARTGGWSAGIKEERKKVQTVKCVYKLPYADTLYPFRQRLDYAEEGIARELAKRLKEYVNLEHEYSYATGYETWTGTVYIVGNSDNRHTFIGRLLGE